MNTWVVGAIGINAAMSGCALLYVADAARTNKQPAAAMALAFLAANIVASGVLNFLTALTN